jgi:hypothetical protein
MLKSNVEIREQSSINELVGEHIGYDLGVKMVKDYFDKYQEGGAQFIGKNILNQILEQPNCIGINVYKALNEQGEKTYVIVGMDKDANPILDITAVNLNGELNKKEGIVADRNFGLGWFDDVIS